MDAGSAGSFLALSDDGNRHWCKVLNNTQDVERIPANFHTAQLDHPPANRRISHPRRRTVRSVAPAVVLCRIDPPGRERVR